VIGRSLDFDLTGIPPLFRWGTEAAKTEAKGNCHIKLAIYLQQKEKGIVRSSSSRPHHDARRRQL
jgi:hypothetical protein